MKKPLLLTLLVLILLTGGYFLYERGFQSKPASTWDFVPLNSLVVYERDNCTECNLTLSDSPLVSLIKRVNKEGKPDSLVHSLNKIVGGSGLLISAHATRKDDFDFVYYVSGVQDVKELTKFRENKAYRMSSREFSGVDIYEIKIEANIFSWIFIENVWVGSFTPFLIEDVIRTYRTGSTPFKNSYDEIFKLPKIQGDAGNVYINLKNASTWVSLFTPENPMLVSALGHSTALDLKVENNTLLLNGFSTDSAEYSRYVLSIFSQQQPVTFNLANLISDRAITVNSFGISDGLLFRDDLTEFRKQTKFQVRDSLKWLAEKSRTDFSELYGAIQDEIVECFVESSRGRRASKILLIESNKVSKWIQTFDRLGEALSIDTLFTERYSDFVIRQVPVRNFPEKLFWPLVSGYEETFYTQFKNFVILGDDVDELKSFLEDIDNENTWGKSVVFNKFLETTLLESNFSVYVNTPKVWTLLGDRLHPRWKRFVNENQQILRSLQLAAIQFSHLNNSYYTHATINYRPITKEVENLGAKSKVVINFPANISSLNIVKSHVTKNDEVLIQDSLNDLSLVGSDGSVLWKISIGDPITSEVAQIDFFGNGKLQYFFSTRNTLHVIDRLGKHVEPYPLYLPSLDIAYATVIDYDHSKKYRFLIAEHSGKLWMYDKDGNNLDGWKPKDVGGPLTSAPSHYRIHGKDYIIAMRQDGMVHLLTRRGEDIKGFPFKLASPAVGDHFLERSNKLSETHFVVVTNDGFKIKFSVDGKVQSKETLLKTSVSTAFSLVREEQGRSYVVVQRDNKSFNILDDGGKNVLTNGFIGAHPAVVKYFEFGSGRTYTAITDEVENLAYIHNGEGDLLTSPPVESKTIGLRPASSDNIKLFIANGTALTILSLD